MLSTVIDQYGRYETKIWPQFTRPGYCGSYSQAADSTKFLIPKPKLTHS